MTKVTREKGHHCQTFGTPLIEAKAIFDFGQRKYTFNIYRRSDKGSAKCDEMYL